MTSAPIPSLSGILRTECVPPNIPLALPSFSCCSHFLCMSLVLRLGQMASSVFWGSWYSNSRLLTASKTGYGHGFGPQ